MPEPWGGSYDFFISHRGGDGVRHTAEVRDALAGAGFRVASQHPDIAPGDNFLARIHEFLKQARDLIVVLTSDYDQSPYTLLELTCFLAEAMQGEQSRGLLVVRVDDCRPLGLLAPFSYLDLVGVADAELRRASIVAAARNEPRIDFTRARRAVGVALRHHLVRASPEEASRLAVLVGDAARTRLVSLDSHAAGVTIDHGASIREFIALYAGVNGVDDMFGGRERELADLTRWLTEPAAPYRLITATAGRGKSMLVVRWALDAVAASDLDVVFIPISIRCQTNTATVILQALVSRLAFLHEQEAPVLTGTEPEALCKAALRYLQTERAGGRRTLVILDGLDESVDREIFRGLLPTNPPPSLRVLLTARSASVTTADDEWRARLGFGATAPRSRRDQLALHTLDRLDAATVTAIAVEALSGHVTDSARDPVAAELVRLSEGEPFVLELYLERVVEAGDASAAAILDGLRHLEPGFHAYFKDWWDQQLTLWRELGVDEDSVIAVLSALSAARGPMAIDDLQALIQPTRSGYAIQSAIGHLGRFLVTSRGQRVAIFHDRMAEFVHASLMSAADLSVVRRRFVDWGLDAAARCAGSPSPSSPVPEYVLRHLGAHLHGDDVALDRLAPLLSRRWADAWLDFEGHHAGFVADVAHVIDRALGRYQRAEEPDERSHAFLLAIEAIVARASAISLAEAVPPELLPLLLEDHLWSGAQVLGYIRTIHRLYNRVSALTAVAPVIPPDQLAAFIDAACAISNAQLSAGALVSIASRVSGQNAQVYLDAVARFRDPVDRSYLLGPVDTSVDIALRQRVLTILEDSQAPDLENHQLATLTIARSRYLDPQAVQATLDAAVTHTRRIAAEEDFGTGRMLKVRSLCELANLAGEPPVGVALVREALDILDSWPHHSGFPRAADALSICAAPLARWAFPDAWALARRLDQDDKGTWTNQGEVLANLAGWFDAALWPGCSAEVAVYLRSVVERDYPDPQWKYVNVRLIFAQLPADLLRLFGAWIATLPEDEEYRWRAEILVLSRLPPDPQRELAQHIIERCAARSPSRLCAEIRAQALAFLPEGKRAQAVRAALLASRSIGDDDQCAITIAALATCLSGVPERWSRPALQLLLASRRGLLRWPNGPLAAPMLRHVDEIQQALRSRPLAEAAQRRARLAIAALTDAQRSGPYPSYALDHLQMSAVFALLGVVPSTILDLEALDRWVSSASLGTRDDIHQWLPHELNRTQVEFLADRVVQIRDGRARVYIGGRIATELVRRDLWRWHMVDVVDQLAVDVLWNHWMLTPTMAQCNVAEAIAIVRSIHGRVDVGSYGVLLRRAIEIMSTGPELDELAMIMLSDLRSHPPSDASAGGYRAWQIDTLVTLCGFPVSPRTVEQIANFLLTVEPDTRETSRRLVAPRVAAAKLDDYATWARGLSTPGARMKALAPIFSRLSTALRDEIFIDVTEWMETRYCGRESLVYLRMSEHCNADAFEAASTMLRQLQRNSSSGGYRDDIRDLLAVLVSWRDAGRITTARCRILLTDLLTRFTPCDRNDAMRTLAAMGPALEPLIGVPVVDVINRIADVVQAWR